MATEIAIRTYHFPAKLQHSVLHGHTKCRRGIRRGPSCTSTVSSFHFLRLYCLRHILQECNGARPAAHLQKPSQRLGMAVTSVRTAHEWSRTLHCTTKPCPTPPCRRTCGVSSLFPQSFLPHPASSPEQLPAVTGQHPRESHTVEPSHPGLHAYSRCSG